MTLIDAGPLVALADADDQHHAQCKAALASLREKLGTVWPVLAEAMYLLSDLPAGQNAVWEMITRGAIALLPLELADVPRICEMMRKYSDRKMDLADAALIRVAERERLHRFFTVDRTDFEVYRLHGRVRPALIP